MYAREQTFGVPQHLQQRLAQVGRLVELRLLAGVLPRLLLAVVGDAAR